MIAKLAIVEEEADESIYWLEMIVESGLMKKSRVEELVRELDEILAMVVASQRTLRRNHPGSKKR